MTSVIKIQNKKYIDYYKYQVYRVARIKIIKCKIGAKEKQLDRFLLKNYNAGLKPLCLWILKNMKFNSDLDDNIIVTIRDPELDQLARLITYGNGRMQGSSILKKAISL